MLMDNSCVKMCLDSLLPRHVFARRVARILWIWRVFILVTYGTRERKCNPIYRIVSGGGGEVNGVLLCIKSLTPLFTLLLPVLPFFAFLSASFMSPRLNVRRMKYLRLNTSLSLRRGSDLINLALLRFIRFCHNLLVFISYSYIIVFDLFHYQYMSCFFFYI